jgi:hypothetical protein
MYFPNLLQLNTVTFEIVSFRMYTPLHSVFHDRKHAWKSFSEIPFRAIAGFSFYLVNVVKMLPFEHIPDSGEQKEVAGGQDPESRVEVPQQ